MPRVTKYCNEIGPLCTVQWDTYDLYTQFSRPFPFYVEVGLSYESSWELVHCLQISTKTHDGTLTFTILRLPQYKKNTSLLYFLQIKLKLAICVRSLQLKQYTVCTAGDDELVGVKVWG